MDVNEQGRYVDNNNRVFTKCYADPSTCFLIDVTGPRVESVWRGSRYWIDFSNYIFSPEVVVAAHKYVCEKLEDHTPAIINEVKSAVKMLASIWVKDWINFSSLSWNELFEIFATATKSEKTYFRRLYTYCSDNEMAGADEIYASELQQLVVGSAATRVILEWDQKRGALTTAEQELVRRAMLERGEESWDANAARLFVWISFETLKRPAQLAGMKADALWSPQVMSGEKSFFCESQK